LDLAVFGADRAPLLEWLREGAAQYAFLVEEGKEIGGYCLGRHGHHFDQVGPVIAKDSSMAKELVSAALNNCIGRPVILDVLHHDPQWTAWLESIGFTRQRSLIRMYRGPNRCPGLPEKQFAIAGPEFG
jgi:hypothetical protein